MGGKYRQQLASLTAACLLLSVGAWGLTVWACYYQACPGWLYSLAPLGASLFVIVSVGLAHRDKAIRLIRGRTSFRPVSEYSLVTYSLQIANIFHKPEAVPMRDETDRGWPVPFSNGNETILVNVYKMELYKWLISCYVRQRRQIGKGSVISHRSNRDLDKLQWAARISLLKKANAVYRNSNRVNSTVYLKVFEDKEPVEAAWYIVDELLEEAEESKKIW